MQDGGEYTVYNWVACTDDGKEIAILHDVETEQEAMERLKEWNT